jgi:Fe-coproporphyrin III synthase
MCDIWKDTSQTEISCADLSGHLEDIQRLGVQWVVFSGGEPLMHSDLFRLADLLRSCGIRVTLLSTGLLLERHAAEIASRVDDLIVSLDGPPAIHDRIRRVPGAYRRLAAGVNSVKKHNSALRITGRCTVQRLNHDHIVETANHARQLGLASISFLAVDVTSTAFNRAQPWDPARRSSITLTESEIGKLEREFDALDQRWIETGFIAENRNKLLRIVRHFRADLSLIERESPQCNAPWVSAVVETDGTVRPCFFQPSIGSLRTEGLFEIMNSFQAQLFRSSLDIATNPTCQKCVCSLFFKQTG